MDQIWTKKGPQNGQNIDFKKWNKIDRKWTKMDQTWTIMNKQL